MEAVYRVTPKHNATLASLLKSIQKGGIERVVVLPIANKPEHVKLNAWYSNLSQQSDKIIPFGSIHPDNDPEELESFPVLGLKGIKLQPNAQLFYPDEERMFKLYEKANELGLIVIFHAGDEEGGVKGEYSQPERFVEVLKAFPDLTVVLPHLGGFRTWDKVDLVLGYDNVYYDTAHLPGVIDDELFLELIEKIGIERVVYGTDFPWSDHSEDRAHVQKLLGDRAHQIFWENPKKLLGIDS
jgi:predicted TIM-barrel fold metal-dependent hydrolase